MVSTLNRLPPEYTHQSASDMEIAKKSDLFGREMLTRRGEILSRVIVIVALFEVVFLLKAFIDDVIIREVMISLALAASCFSYVALTRYGRFEFSVHSMIISLIVVTTTGVVTNGGVYEPVFGWLVITSPIAGLVGGIRTCRFWSIVVAILILSLVIMDSMGIRWENLTPDNSVMAQKRLHVIGLIVLMPLLVLSFLKKIEESDKRVEHQLEIIQKEVSARKNAEKKAILSDKAKTHFLANMSHELRTPLNSIIGFSHRLVRKSGAFKESDAAAIEVILTNGQRLHLLVNTLLELADLESSKFDMRLLTLDLASLVEEAAGVMELKQNKGKTEIDIGELSSFEVIGDARRIHQLLKNIFDYATHNECKKIVIEMLVAVDGKEAVITVSNTDDPIDVSRIKGMFSAEDEDAVNGDIDRPSAALGLAIAANLVAKHRGIAGVENNDEGGVTFKITFPAASEFDSA